MSTKWQAESRDWIQYSERFLFLQIAGKFAKDETWGRLLTLVVPNIPAAEAGTLAVKLLSGGWDALRFLPPATYTTLSGSVTTWQAETNLRADWCAVAAVATAERLKKLPPEAQNPTAADVESAAKALGTPITRAEAERIIAKERGADMALETGLRMSTLSVAFPAWDPDLQTEAEFRRTVDGVLRELRESKRLDNYIESVRLEATSSGRRFAISPRRSTLSADMRRLVRWQILGESWPQIAGTASSRDPHVRRTRTNTVRQRCKEIAQGLGLSMRQGSPGRPRG